MSRFVDFNQDFIERVVGDVFLTDALLNALNEESPVSVRCHPAKVRPDLPVLKEVNWCENAFYLSERPSFTLDPLFHAGGYYPQEAGSMLLDTIVRRLELPENPHVLDLCGAPGGKSTLLLSFLDNAGLLVSNEVIQSRARILKENSSKWGYSNNIVTNNDPSDFHRLTGFFDLILVDAPCSGEGMFRKDPKSRNEWSMDNVKLCSARQKRILSDVWESLTPGGLLIYSTCTFNEDENEGNVAWILNELGGELTAMEMPETIQAGRNGIGHYALPGKSETEGFYVAVIRKNGQQEHTIKKSATRDLSICKDVTEISEFANLDGIEVMNWKEHLLAVPTDMKNAFFQVYNDLRIVKFGTELGTMARKGFVPDHDLAMNFSLRRPDRTIELNKEQALKYLKGETFLLENSKGFFMVSYQDEPLGWIKNLGNRFNNLYPRDWRIKMNIN